jgi:peptide/nickel transport system substrate-binding protein
LIFHSNAVPIMNEGERMKKSLKLPVLIAVALSTALLSSTLAVAAPKPGEVGSTTLRASHPQKPNSWNYLQDGASAFFVPAYLNILESLFETSATGELKPLLATKYTVSKDGRTYTIDLRKATFHDGSEFTSEDVVYSLEKNKTSLNGLLSAPLSIATSIKASGPSRVIVKLSRPSNAFREALGQPATMITTSGYFESDNVGKKLIGTGPFSFGAFRQDVDLHLNRFAKYYGTKPFFKKVIHQFRDDESATISALKTGQLDVVGMLFGAGIDQVKPFITDKKYQTFFWPSTSASYLFLNPKTKALQDIRVRKAIAHAINRKPIIDAAVGGYAEPGCVMVPTWTSPWNSDYCPYPYSVAKAKALLKDAGYADGLTLDFPYLTLAEFPTSFEVVSAQLAAVGITIAGRGLEFGTWIEKVWSTPTPEYDINHITNNAPLSTFGCKGVTPPYGYEAACDEKFESLIASSDSLVNPKKYVAAMKETANYIADQAWIIEIFSKNEPGIANAKLTGIAKYRTSMEMDYRNIKWAK